MVWRHLSWPSKEISCDSVSKCRENNWSRAISTYKKKSTNRLHTYLHEQPVLDGLHTDARGHTIISPQTPPLQFNLGTKSS
jgi:hypothetical protein